MSHSEFIAMLDLLMMLVLDWRTGVLLLLLFFAAYSDYRSHRIPNALVLAGLLFGMLYNLIVPAFPGTTRLLPLWGLMTGLLMFLPMYALGIMGAGDVKLMAMVGAFLGPGETLQAVLASLIAGGILALVHVIGKGTGRRLLHNISMLFRQGLFALAHGALPDWQLTHEQSAGKMPFGVAIAVGTTTCLVLAQLGLL